MNEINEICDIYLQHIQDSVTPLKCYNNACKLNFYRRWSAQLFGRALWKWKFRAHSKFKNGYMCCISTVGALIDN